MRRPSKFFALLLPFGAASALSGCGEDYLTGQDEDPEELLITRLTLFDGASRDHAVFTDTSAPNDCEGADRMAQRCQFDPLKDSFGQKKSPPTPYSGYDIRVVFNKLPFRLGSEDLSERTAKDAMGNPIDLRGELNQQSVLALKCESGCQGVPPYKVYATLAGSGLSPAPNDVDNDHNQLFPYGPALQIVVPEKLQGPFEVTGVAALEPDATYSVTVDARLTGRSGLPVKLDAMAMALLRFKTEPFKVLQVGMGDADHDPYVYEKPSTDLDAGEIPNNGAIGIKLNAPIHGDLMGVATATLTPAGGAPVTVPLLFGVKRLGHDENDMEACLGGRQNVLFIYPAERTVKAPPMADRQARTWGPADGPIDVYPAGTEITVTLDGSKVFALAQSTGNPKSSHSLAGTFTIKAKLLGRNAFYDAGEEGSFVGVVATVKGAAPVKEGEDDNGSVRYAAGRAGLTISHEVSGMPNQMLAVTVEKNMMTMAVESVIVKLGTDAGGKASSTAKQVADAITAQADLKDILWAEASGSGAGLAGATTEPVKLKVEGFAGAFSHSDECPR